MIRATLDVNVLVSGFTGSSGAPAELIALWLRRQYAVVLSEHILAGVEKVWDRPYWRGRVSVGDVQRSIALMRARAVLVVPDFSVRGIGEDEEDDRVLATAVSGSVDLLVTGDRLLRAIGRIQDVEIFTPREFLDLLEAGEPRST